MKQRLYRDAKGRFAKFPTIKPISSKSLDINEYLDYCRDKILLALGCLKIGHPYGDGVILGDDSVKALVEYLKEQRF